MATFEERHSTRATQESLFYERCWRCRCVVPNGLVRRRTMKTGSSTGSILGTGAAFADLGHYEAVSLCGVCYEELETAEWQRTEKRYRRWAFVGRIVGIAYCTLVLTRAAGFPFGVSLSTALTFAYFRIVGRAIVTLHSVTLLAVFIGYPPRGIALKVEKQQEVSRAGRDMTDSWGRKFPQQGVRYGRATVRRPLGAFWGASRSTD